jgi:hypothetical protein
MLSQTTQMNPQDRSLDSLPPSPTPPSASAATLPLWNPPPSAASGPPSALQHLRNSGTNNPLAQVRRQTKAPHRSPLTIGSTNAAPLTWGNQPGTPTPQSTSSQDSLHPLSTVGYNDWPRDIKNNIPHHQQSPGQHTHHIGGASNGNLSGNGHTTVNGGHRFPPSTAAATMGRRMQQQNQHQQLLQVNLLEHQSKTQLHQPQTHQTQQQQLQQLQRPQQSQQSKQSQQPQQPQQPQQLDRRSQQPRPQTMLINGIPPSSLTSAQLLKFQVNQAQEIHKNSKRVNDNNLLIQELRHQIRIEIDTKKQITLQIQQEQLRKQQQQQQQQNQQQQHNHHHRPQSRNQAYNNNTNGNKRNNSYNNNNSGNNNNNNNEYNNNSSNASDNNDSYYNNNGYNNNSGINSSHGSYNNDSYNNDSYNNDSYNNDSYNDSYNNDSYNNNNNSYNKNKNNHYNNNMNNHTNHNNGRGMRNQNHGGNNHNHHNNNHNHHNNNHNNHNHYNNKVRNQQAKNAKGQIDVDAIRSGKEARTTVMVCNIPNRYTRTELMNEFDAKGKRTLVTYCLCGSCFKENLF